MMTFSVFVGCTEVPITQLESLSLDPESELVSMSFKEYQQVLDKNKLSTDQNNVQTVRRVGNRIANIESYIPEAMPYYQKSPK